MSRYGSRFIIKPFLAIRKAISERPLLLDNAAVFQLFLDEQICLDRLDAGRFDLVEVEDSICTTTCTMVAATGGKMGTFLANGGDRNWGEDFLVDEVRKS